MFPLTLVLLLAAFASGDGEANETPPPQANHLETITVTADRTEVTIKESTAKVTVIQADQIEKRLVTDIRDLLRYEPGLSVANDPTRLGLNGFIIRGMGGNRVLTQIDGVQTTEQFSFGPLATNQFFVDVDTLKQVEVVRSASSSLYGSDALGGLVSFETKDPEDYLRGVSDYFRVKTGYDGKNESGQLGLSSAFTVNRFQALLHYTGRSHSEVDNQGDIDSFDATRTLPNNSDTDSHQVLFKGVWNLSTSNRVRVTADWRRTQTDTNIYSGQGEFPQFGSVVEIRDNVADDEQNRVRLSLDQRLTDIDLPLADQLDWRIFVQNHETNQVTNQVRSTTTPFPSSILRTGTMEFDQDDIGVEITARKFFEGAGNHQLIYGLALTQSDFAQVRDRNDFDLLTSTDDVYAGTLIFPTRYFPKSEILEAGAYIQLESYFFDDRLRVVPGLRYDRTDLDPDQNDAIYQAAIQSEVPPVSLSDDSVSPKLGIHYSVNDYVAFSGQYSRGFRTPPYNSVNNGFSNPAGGYQTLANPDLKPETSDNIEFSFKLSNNKGALQLTWFDAQFEDFINNTVFVGVSNQGLALFQPQNIDNVEINGIELEGDLRLSNRWSLRGAYANIEGEQTDTGTPLNNIEPEKFTLGIAYQSVDGRYGGTLHNVFSAEKDASDVDDPDNTLFLTDDYTLLDLNLYWRFNSSFTANFGAFNITDETYYPWTDVSGRQAADPTVTRFSAPGRNFSIHFSYEW